MATRRLEFVRKNIVWDPLERSWDTESPPNKRGWTLCHHQMSRLWHLKGVERIYLCISDEPVRDAFKIHCGTDGKITLNRKKRYVPGYDPLLGDNYWPVRPGRDYWVWVEILRERPPQRPTRSRTTRPRRLLASTRSYPSPRPRS